MICLPRYGFNIAHSFLQGDFRATGAARAAVNSHSASVRRRANIPNYHTNFQHGDRDCDDPKNGDVVPVKVWFQHCAQLLARRFPSHGGGAGRRQHHAQHLFGGAQTSQIITPTFSMATVIVMILRMVMLCP
jgi:hypothetical protein